MPKLIFNEIDYECKDNETVLESLQRHGVEASFSCRSGICHICLLRCTKGSVPEKAQLTLKESLKERGYFLACKCRPQEDMDIALPRDADLYSPALVYAKEQLAPDIVRLLLEPATSLYYHAGQFINLRRPDGLSRSYSLVSVPNQDYFLEVHVKRLPGGEMSNWLCDELKVEDELEIQGPQGLCYYYSGRLDQNLLLIGTGTGLAPLLGIIKDALNSGHNGNIHLYHGSRSPDGLYLQDTLREMSEQHSNFFYIPCLSGNTTLPGHEFGRANEVAFEAHKELKGWRVYLCGHPDMVYAAEKQAELAGVSSGEIYIDPYLLSHDESGDDADTKQKNNNTMESVEERRLYPDPDPEIWAALKNGNLLMEILIDFYTQVYDDPRLASFFENSTKQRAIEKQYNFLCQVFTGEKVYFGDRPRNAHHWMVISDELFDYREELMAACLRKYGLTEHLIQRWRSAEELYRKQIVKSKPWKKIIDGVELPLDGYGELVLEYGSICDGCQSVIEPGEIVRYHLRLGTTFCKSCMQDKAV